MITNNLKRDFGLWMLSNNEILKIMETSEVLLNAFYVIYGQESKVTVEWNVVS